MSIKIIIFTIILKVDHVNLQNEIKILQNYIHPHY